MKNISEKMVIISDNFINSDFCFSTVVLFIYFVLNFYMNFRL